MNVIKNAESALERLPMWLIYLENHIFESLPLEDAEEWASNFYEVISEGVDVPNSLNDRFQIFLLKRQKMKFDQDEFSEIVGSINAVLKLLKKVLDGRELSVEEWRGAGELAKELAKELAVELEIEELEKTSTKASAGGSEAETAAWLAADIAEQSSVWSASVAAMGVTSREDPPQHQEVRAQRDWLLSELKLLK